MKTDMALRKEGISILMDYLGHVDAERFIALISNEPFDYTKWREDNLPNESVRELSKKAMEFSKTL